jgi:alkylation response protein AidB-like acyl-CoA dehydrogenase
MDFSFTDEQNGLREAVRRLGSEHAAVDADRAAVWRAVTQQLGLTGIGIDEEFGGAGGDFVDAAVVIEEAGRTLLPAPLTTTLVAGTVLQRCGPGAAPYAAAVAGGETVAVVAAGAEVRTSGDSLTGRLPHVLDGDVADLVLVAGPDGLWAVDVRAVGDDAIRVHPQVPLDASRGQADIELTNAAAARLGDTDAASAAVDTLRVALALEAVGAARHCFELTLDYLKTREQFGRPIGSFQALQHRAADLTVALEAAASTAYYAAWVVADAPDELAVMAPVAKSVCGEAAWRVAAETIQMHGGIGFTWEHPAHRYFKRITTIRLLLGDAREQRRLVAERAGLASGLAVSGSAPSGP